MTRYEHNPIIKPESDVSIGNNINGPSIIKVPSWVRNPLGKYYLYFASHRGTAIRLAYADDIFGPYKIYRKGVLLINKTPFKYHIASPDVHVDDTEKKIYMYYHGRNLRLHASCYAESTCGLEFKSEKTIICKPYMRVFECEDKYYCFCGCGDNTLYSSNTRNGIFTEETKLEIKNTPTNYTRHVCLYVEKKILHIFYTNIDDKPERIKKIAVFTNAWCVSEPIEILKPERDYEGANLPLENSTTGPINKRVNQLRDPYVYIEDKERYLFYTIAGESGIAVAKF